MTRIENLGLGMILFLALGVRLMGIDQPIVENYVGRQIPTAMVARNLERRSSFLYPELDVAPRPNYFLIEPPLYAEIAVLVRRLTGLPLGASGRVVSALGIALGAWGLFGLVRRRVSIPTALVAMAVFVCLPVTIRYGRAFQPDALMIGCLIAGMRCWDDYEAGRRPIWLALGVAFLSVGLALKIISAYVFAPIVFGVMRTRQAWKLGLLFATVMPALLWYLHAASVLSAGGGSHAMADNGAIWLRVFAFNAWFKWETYENVARFLGIRAFTPIGPILAILGLRPWLRERADHIWLVWSVSVFAAMVLLAAKLHHEYYWLALAPAIAVGIARFLMHTAYRTSISLLFIGLCILFSASTWKTPAEWQSLRSAAEAVRSAVPAGMVVVAPEALLYESERQGCRVEYTVPASRRAAGEWNDRRASEVDDPASLVEFYRRHGARFFADVVPVAPDPRRLALHESVRRRYNVVIDRAGVLIASLNEPNEAVAHGQVSQEPRKSSRASDDPRLRPVEGAGP